MVRREFLGSAVAVTAASAARVSGAHRRLRVGLVGCGGRGRYVARLIDAVPDVDYVAFCDAYDKQAEEARQQLGGQGDCVRDFRRLLDRKDIDAIHIATPDHWHAIPAVLACQAGKHVYVEKPFAHNVREGQAMVRAAKASKVVFLTGTQQRSAPHFAEVAEIIQSGKLRDVHFVRVWNYANLMPAGVGAEPDSEPPPGLDWDLYLGPAPWVPFNRKRFLGSYRAFFDYSGGWITDFGVHRFDTVHQIMGKDRPRTVSASGGRFCLKGLSDQPDLLCVTWEYDGFVMSYETSSINGFGAMGRTNPQRTYYRMSGADNRPNGMAFYGSNGTLLADRLGYEVIPEDRTRETPFGEPGVLEDSGLRRRFVNATDATRLHAEHFVRCIRDGETPRCDAEAGHRSTLVAHLGNIAYKTGQKLRWDADREDFVGAPDASKLLSRPARKPWDLL